MNTRSTFCQRGVFTIITAVGSILLVAILGVVVDGTRLMVIQGELQNATDACALAAAAELNGITGATSRAANVGSKVGALNKKNFQSESAGISQTDVKFSKTSNGSYVSAIASVNSQDYRFVQCTAMDYGWVNLFMNLLVSDPIYPVATTKAGLQQTRKACILPLVVVANQNALVRGNLLNPTSIKITNFDNPVSSKTIAQYSDMIIGFGQCDVSTDFRIINVDDGSSPIYAALLTDTGPTNPLRKRYENAISDSSGKQLIALPWITAIGSPIRSWVCLELESSGSIKYLGDINDAAHIPTNRCLTVGIGGFNAKGPFTPVLVR